jgi:hypothetical protein
MGSKAEAAEYALKIAETYGDPERRSDVWVPDEGGKLRLAWSGTAPARRVA